MTWREFEALVIGLRTADTRLSRWLNASNPDAAEGGEPVV
jgi:hypothetical protein